MKNNGRKKKTWSREMGKEKEEKTKEVEEEGRSWRIKKKKKVERKENGKEKGDKILLVQYITKEILKGIYIIPFAALNFKVV